MVSVSRAVREQTIIANGDLVGCSKDRDELLLILKNYPQLSVIVLSVSLQQACKLKGTSDEEIKAIKANLRQISQITIISKDNLNLDKLERFFAQQEYAKRLVRNYDPDKHFGFINEVAYALLEGINTIVVSNAEDYQLTENINNLNIWSLEKLQEKYPLSPLLVFKTTIKILTKWIKNNKAWSFLLLFLITFLGVVVIPRIIDIFVFHYYCPLDINELISCGERILITEEDEDLQLFENHQENARGAFEDSEYDNAVSNFKNAFKQYKSPETLVYFNNALLEANRKKANTIAVAVPISQSNRNTTNEEKGLAKEILRGVAHVQTLVNKCLLPDEFDFLPDSIQENNSLCEKIKQKGKGLRVIIADDANNEAQAQNLASQLNELKDKSIFAVIGHYASDLTNEVIYIYNRNKIVLFSVGSTSESPSFMKPDDYFFRTVPSVTFPANKLVQYMKEEGYKNPAIFYNEDSNFSKSMYDTFKTKAEDKQIPINPELVFNNKSDYFAERRFNVSDAINKSQIADVIVLFPDGQTSKSFDNGVKIIMANNGNKPILGTWNLRSNRILRAAKGNPKTVINEKDKKLIIYNFYDQSKTPNEQYVQEGNALWGNANPPLTATSYDAAWVLVNAFLQNINRTNLKDTLNQMGTIENGATGEITFDENGNRNNLEGFLLEVVKDNTNKDTGLKFVPLN